MQDQASFHQPRSALYHGGPAHFLRGGGLALSKANFLLNGHFQAPSALENYLPSSTVPELSNGMAGCWFERLGMGLYGGGLIENSRTSQTFLFLKKFAPCGVLWAGRERFRPPPPMGGGGGGGHFPL